jgi:hypothetical protein
MNCGKKYENMVVNASGYTTTNPYGSFATPYDYSEWREVAFRLAVRVKVHFDRLKNTAGADADLVAGFGHEIEAIERSVDELPGIIAGTWNGITLVASISEAIGSATNSACLMESIDKETVRAGGTSPTEGDGRHASAELFNFNSIANVALLGGLGYLAWTLTRKVG